MYGQHVPATRGLLGATGHGISGTSWPTVVGRVIGRALLAVGRSSLDSPLPGWLGLSRPRCPLSWKEESDGRSNGVEGRP